MEVSIWQLRVHGAAQLTRSSSFASGTRPSAPCSPWSVVFPPCPPPVTNFHRSEEHTSELQSRLHLVCRLLLEKKKKNDSAMSITQPSSSIVAIKLIKCRSVTHW